MSEPFSLILDTTAHAGQLPALRPTISALANDVRANEPGTLDFRSFVDEASNRLCFFDTYASSEAFLAHLGRQTVSDALDQIMAHVDINAFTVMGNVTPQVREALQPFGATVVRPNGGFNRIQIPTVTI